MSNTKREREKDTPTHFRSIKLITLHNSSKLYLNTCGKAVLLLKISEKQESDKQINIKYVISRMYMKGKRERERESLLYASRNKHYICFFFFFF
jgi:hypothetical protein